MQDDTMSAVEMATPLVDADAAAAVFVFAVAVVIFVPAARGKTTPARIRIAMCCARVPATLSKR